MNRRGLLAAIAASGTVAVAGCAAEGGSYEFDAEPARVPAEARSETEYAGEEPEPFTIEREFDIAGVSARVSATTWIARYVNETVGAALFVASTPDASVGGQSVNPLLQRGDTELLRRLLEQTNQRGIAGGDADVRAGDIEARGEETRTVLGEMVSVSILETTLSADVEGSDGQDVTAEDVPVIVYVGTVRHDGDVIALIGVQPVGVDESDTLLALMERVEH